MSSMLRNRIPMGDGGSDGERSWQTAFLLRSNLSKLKAFEVIFKLRKEVSWLSWMCSKGLAVSVI